MTDESYVQFAIPGVPYSAVKIPLLDDLEEFDTLVAHTMLRAQNVAQQYRSAFGTPELPAPYQERQEAQEPPPLVRQPSQPVQNGRAPQRAQAASRAPQRQAAPQRRAATQTLDPDLIVEGYCPDHPDVKALPSLPKWQEVEMGEDGYERYAKYFCPGKENGTGQNHNLYARQLVTVEPDDLPF